MARDTAPSKGDHKHNVHNHKYDIHPLPISTTPLWDDASGIIYTIPDIPNYNPTRAHADVVRSNPSTLDVTADGSVRKHAHGDVAQKEASMNESVKTQRRPRAVQGGSNTAGGSRGDDCMRRPTPLGLDSRRFARSFIPYFEPDEVRNAEDLGRSGVARDVGGKDQTAKSMTMGSKKGSSLATDSAAVQRGAESPEVGSKGSFHSHRRSARDAQTITQPTAYPVESSLGFAKPNNRSRKHKRTSSRTLEKVRQIRAEESKISKVKFLDPQCSEPSEPLRELVKVTDIPEQSPSCTPERDALRKDTAAINTEETENLAQAVKELNINQENSSSSLESHVAKDEVAVPIESDLEKSKAERSALKEERVNEISRDTDRNMQDGLQERAEAGNTQEEDCSSDESIASYDYDKIESITMPLWDETEKNGGTRKWYKLHK